MTTYSTPNCSQVAVSPPGSAQLQWLGSVGHVTSLVYSFVCPGGCDQMTCTLEVPASYRNQMLNPGWTVRVFRGGHQVWDGKMDEPVPTASGWNLTAVGTGQLGQNFAAFYTYPWPEDQPDEPVSRAITRGLPWVNPGIGQPSWAWYGQAVDPAAQTITDLLNLICTRGGATWYVNSQPGGYIGDNLSLFTLPTTVSRLLVASTPVARTLGGDINTIYLRYEASAPTTSTTSTNTSTASATYGTAFVQNSQSVALHGEMETFIDLSDAGVMTSTSAQTVGEYVLSIYQRASFAGPFTVTQGQLLTTGGQAVDCGADQAGTVVRLILSDYGMGGEVTPNQPITFIVGQYAWDDTNQTATVTPYQALDTSLSGLLQLEGTLLTPVSVSN